MKKVKFSSQSNSQKLGLPRFSTPRKEMRSVSKSDRNWKTNWKPSRHGSRNWYANRKKSTNKTRSWRSNLIISRSRPVSIKSRNLSERCGPMWPMHKVKMRKIRNGKFFSATLIISIEIRTLSATDSSCWRRLRLTQRNEPATSSWRSARKTTTSRSTRRTSLFFWRGLERLSNCTWTRTKV